MAPQGRTRNIILGYITVFLDVLGYSIVVPILPYLSKSLGANAIYPLYMPFYSTILQGGIPTNTQFHFLCIITRRIHVN